ncbi:ATP-binding protein [Sphingomonas ginkgonis]|uniref:ATP-binding protein n=1 Tax=Sphingomonas ginkgonis TaxID=2315330 RepID=UPI000F861504|nr:ATP-binding protein [Sphingomonas ginkgonis]
MRTKGMLLGVACILLIILIGILQLQVVWGESRLLAQVQESNARHRTVASYLSLLQDVETGQRGYVVTGKPEFLQPFEHSARLIGPIEAELVDFYKPHSPEGRDVAILVRLGQAKLAFSRLVIARRQSAGEEDAAAIIGRGEGKRLMDRARIVAGTVERHEREHANALAFDHSGDRQRLQLVIVVAELLLLAAAASLLGSLLASIRSIDRARDEASDSARRQSAIFENASDAMMLLDHRGDIETVNVAAEQLFGHPRTEIIGRSNRFLFAQPPREEDSLAYLDRLAREDARTAATQNFAGRRANGSFVEVEVVTTPVRLNDGLHFLAVARDSTERRKVERLKSEFVATVSHELRTPLTSIAGSLGLLSGGAAGALPDKAARLIGIAHSNSQRLVRLINDILDIEKMESGKVVFEPQLLPVAALLAQAVQANLGFADQHGVGLLLAEVADNESMIADPDRMMQVLTNLLSNAIKYSPKNGTVRITSHREGVRQRISISDEGPGIPDEFRTRIFGKFAQADSTDTRLIGGTGLGLAIVKEIVERSGGLVSFDSTPGQGTTFHIDLPTPFALRRPVAAGDQRVRAGDKRCQILHVEDDADTLRLVASAFDGLADVHSTPSAQEAQASLYRFHYDAVILDVTMRDGSGLDLVPLISELEGETPIVLFTAADIGPATRAGVDGVLIKSRSTLADLVATVEQLLHGERELAAE